MCQCVFSMQVLNTLALHYSTLKLKGEHFACTEEQT